MKNISTPKAGLNARVWEFNILFGAGFHMLALCVDAPMLFWICYKLKFFGIYESKLDFKI